MGLLRNVFAVVLLASVAFINPLVGAQAKKRPAPAQEAGFREKKPLEQISILKSIVDPASIAKIVAREYGFEKPVKCKILNIGLNDIYYLKVGDDEMYVVKLTRFDHFSNKGEEDFLFELELLEFLHQRQISVSYPIRRKDGRAVTFINTPEGPRYAVLFTFAPGNEDLDEKQAYILGQELARLHIATEGFTSSQPAPQLDLENLVNKPLERIAAYLKGHDPNNVYEVFEKTAVTLRELLPKIPLDKQYYGVVLGDFHGFNQHFDENNQVTFFDLEFCAYGPRIYDLATFRWFRGTNKKLWDPFLEGYKSVRPLNDVELSLIDIFIMARNLWWVGWMVTMPEYEEPLDDSFWPWVIKRFFVTDDDDQEQSNDASATHWHSMLRW